jgi:hypothetical protein
MSTRIFNFGDSRTGTSSLHQYLRVAGFDGIHHYEREAGITSSSMPEDLKKNYAIAYIKKSHYQTFSDYPTRLVYTELSDLYPEALFILTKRSNRLEWIQSVRHYFDLSHSFALEWWDYMLKIDYEIEEFFAFKKLDLIKIDISTNFSSEIEELNLKLGIIEPQPFPWVNRYVDKK